MKKSEKRCLIFVTVSVCVLLVIALVFVSLFAIDYIQGMNKKGYSENNQRDIFEECAYIAQAQMNCYNKEKSISKYTTLYDWYSNEIGFCFFFEPSGYVIITSYDYAPQVVEPNDDSPFYSFESDTDDYYCVYSLQPTVAVLASESEDMPRKYRTFDCGSCFVVDEDSPFVYASDGNMFDYWDRIYPGVQLSYLEDAEYFSSMVCSDESFRERMLKTADKQMAETGYDVKNFFVHIDKMIG